MKYLFFFLFVVLISLSFSKSCKADFGCTFTANTTQSNPIYKIHLVPNRNFQVFEWNHYEMNFHFEEGLFATFRIRDEYGHKTVVRKSFPFDQNPVFLKILFDGYLFQVACIYTHPDYPMHPQVFTMDEDDQAEWSADGK